MKHNLNDDQKRAMAIRQLSHLIKAWRMKPWRGTSKRAAMETIVVALECGVQALGGDPDGPETQPQK